MQAIVLHPAKVTFAIAEGNLAAIKAEYASRAMTTHGFIGTDEETDLSEFQEWCFDHTNMNEDYRAKGNRGMSVGDVLVVINHGAFACMNSGWEKIE